MATRSREQLQAATSVAGSLGVRNAAQRMAAHTVTRQAQAAVHSGATPPGAEGGELTNAVKGLGKVASGIVKGVGKVAKVVIKPLKWVAGQIDCHVIQGSTSPICARHKLIVGVMQDPAAFAELQVGVLGRGARDSLAPTRQRVRTTARCPDPRPRQSACDQHGTPDMNAEWEKIAKRWATRVRVYSPALHQEIMAAKAAGGQLEHYRPADEYTLLKDIQACQATARGPCSAEPPRRPAAPHARPRACCPQQRHRLARKHAVRTAPQRSSWPVKR